MLRCSTDNFVGNIDKYYKITIDFYFTVEFHHILTAVNINKLYLMSLLLFIYLYF